MCDASDTESEDDPKEAKTEDAWEKKGVQEVFQRKFAARSQERKDMSLRKAKVMIGAKPEERQPLACILLGSLSGAHEYAVAMVDTGCTAYQVCTQDVMRYLLKYHPKCVLFVKELEEPIDIDTCSKEGGTRVTHQMGIRFRYISDTGQPSEEYIYECDVIEGGSTGDCTVLQGNTLCEDLSMQICFQKGQRHYFTIEPEQNRRFPYHSHTHNSKARSTKPGAMR